MNLKEAKLEIKSSEKKHYVYALYRPSGTIFYVGIGTGNRVACHFNAARKDGNLHKKAILTKYGQNISIEILYFTDHKHEAAKIEKDLIKYFGRRDIGTGCLTNMTDGGEGQASPSAEATSKRISKVVGLKRSLEQKERMRKGFMDNNSKSVYCSEYNLTFANPQLALLFAEQITNRVFCKDAMYTHIRKNIKLANLTFKYVDQVIGNLITCERQVYLNTENFHVSDDVFRPVYCEQLDIVFNNSKDAIDYLQEIGFEIGYKEKSKAAHNIVRVASGNRKHCFGGLVWKFYEV